MNPRVLAWARSVGIDDPTILVQEGDQYRIDGLPWTIFFSEWITAKWREWRKFCPDPKGKGCYNHCYNHAKFDAWLNKERV